jgi:glycosyltransferase involved in cell wall biosynthesis
MAAQRLLFVGGGSYVYGLEKVIIRLVQGLAERGYDLFCTVSGWNDGDYTRALAHIGVPYQEILLGWYYLRKPSWSLNSMRHAPAALAEYRRLLRTFRPDLVFHSSYRSLALLGCMIGRNNVMVIQDYWHKHWENRLVHLFDKRVRSYISPCDDIRSRLIAKGFSAWKIERVYNPAAFEEVIRRVIRVPPREVPAMGIVGQVIERKGHHVVVEALALIHKRFPTLKFQLKIFGNGSEEYAKRVRALADARGVTSFIEWCGYRTNMDDIFPEVDFTLVPTVDPDPLPLAAIEPAVYGKPVIASTTGGLPEIVRDHLTGFLVPPGDAESLAARIATLIKNPNLVRTLGEQAYTDYKARFDGPVFLNQYCRIIDRLVVR